MTLYSPHQTVHSCINTLASPPQPSSSPTTMQEQQPTLPGVLAAVPTLHSRGTGSCVSESPVPSPILGLWCLSFPRQRPHPGFGLYLLLQRPLVGQKLTCRHGVLQPGVLRRFMYLLRTPPCSGCRTSASQITQSPRPSDDKGSDGGALILHYCN